MALTQWQILELVKPIDRDHVENKRGLSYIAQHSARAVLTKIFGFGNWDTQVDEMTLVYERMLEPGDVQFPAKGQQPIYWVCCYRAGVRLNIRDYWGNEICSFVEYHVEENAPLPNRGEAHAMACTSAESYAFRRAAFGISDRLGLSLYNKGSLVPIVQRVGQLDDPQSPTYYNPEQTAPPEVRGPEQTSNTPRQLRTFKKAQERVQEMNAAARDPYLERAQAGMKVDES